jgi:TonB family protein
MRCFLHLVVPMAIAVASPLAVAKTAFAQDSPMAAAASQIASAISDSEQKSVVVLDFSGPEAKVTVLGQQLADDFSAALEKSATSFRVEKRSLIADARHQYRFAPEVLANPKTARGFAASLQVEAFVMGDLSVEGDKLSVLVWAYRVQDGKGIKGYRITWLLTQEMRELLNKDLTEIPFPSDLANFPKAGKNGYSIPACIRCLRPLTKGFQGIVTLEVVVRKDGTVGDIRVLKGMRPEINKTVIDAVKQWRLDPARGPDKSPVDVVEIVEISGQLY